MQIYENELLRKIIECETQGVEIYRTKETEVDRVMADFNRLGI